MKNHPVNNDYVQNLQEGLLTEAALRMGKKEKGAKPRKTHVGEEDNMGNVATNSARRKNIKDVGMKPMSGTGPGEVRPHNSGSITTRKLKKVEEAVVSEANYPHKAGLSRGIDVDNRSKLAGHLRKTRNAPDKDSAIKSANDTERRPRFQTSPGQEKIVAAASDKALESNLNKRIDKDSDFSNFGTPPSLRKKKNRVDEAAVRLDKKVKGEKPFQSRDPKTNRLESEISNNDDYTVPSKIERDGSVKKGSTEQNATQSNEDWLTDNDEPKRKDRNDGARLKRKLARKVKPAPVAAAQMESKQTVYQSADKPENNSYLDKDVKLDPFPVKKLKKKKDEKGKVDESFDITDSRLSDEDAKIDQNVKTRGVKKKKGQKPVPMVNSDGEKIGEQDSGVRPRSQDLNTQGRLNKSREGEGMLAKGKRFIKKKFA